MLTLTPVGGPLESLFTFTSEGSKSVFTFCVRDVQTYTRLVAFINVYKEKKFEV